MISICDDDARGLTLMAQKSAPAAVDPVWAAFEAEALPHLDRLFRLAMWFERNRSEAEDLVQETMMQALQSFHRFQPGTNCRAWLTTILQNVRSNRRRARGRSPLVDDPDDRIGARDSLCAAGATGADGRRAPRRAGADSCVVSRSDRPL